MKQNEQHEETSMERIGGILDYAPQSDIPFGKRFLMGRAEYIIYDQAIEQGYTVGVATHLKFIQDHDYCAPVILSDGLFSQVLNSLIPKGMTEQNSELWRAHFIAGWASVYLGLVREGLSA